MVPAVDPPARILCPLCLRISRRLTSGDCEHCGETIPAAYARRYSHLRPLAVPAFGWSGHGKTCFLVALTDFLARVTLVWEDSSCREADAVTREFLVRGNNFVHSGELPPPTPESVRERLCLLMEGIGGWGDPGLIFEESSGQHFHGLEVPADHLSMLTRSPHALLIVSPADLHRPELRQAQRRDGRHIDMLFNTYLDATQSGDGASNTGKRSLVVTLTKADLLRDQLPSDIETYLIEDPLSTLLAPRESTFGMGRSVPSRRFHADSYLAEMKTISSSLRDWLSDDPYFRGLTAKAARNGIELRFSITSATGEVVQEDNSLPVLWRPKRVLDPFFWVLELEREHGGLVSFVGSMDLGGEEGDFSLLVQDKSSSSGPKKINLQSPQGSLASITADLSGVTFSRSREGVHLRFPGLTSLSVRRGGAWEHGTGTNLLVRAGEALSTGTWEIEVRKGHFSRILDS